MEADLPQAKGYDMARLPSFSELVKDVNTMHGRTQSYPTFTAPVPAPVRQVSPMPPPQQPLMEPQEDHSTALCTREQQEGSCVAVFDPRGKLLEKPVWSYCNLIEMAITSAPQNRLTLNEIYEWIANHFPYYKYSTKNWKNAIRHNLSLHSCFAKVQRQGHGKGCYWMMSKDVEATSSTPLSPSSTTSSSPPLSASASPGPSGFCNGPVVHRNPLRKARSIERLHEKSQRRTASYTSTNMLREWSSEMDLHQHTPSPASDVATVVPAGSSICLQYPPKAIALQMQLAQLPSPASTKTVFDHVIVGSPAPSAGDGAPVAVPTDRKEPISVQLMPPPAPRLHLGQYAQESPPQPQQQQLGPFGMSRIWPPQSAMVFSATIPVPTSNSRRYSSDVAHLPADSPLASLVQVAESLRDGLQ